ncbi:MAG: gamma-glutamyltransferase [Ferruginibacter sp.]|nr:gamma-glutamyltransferase [Ferruginibacter sp.]
MNKQIITIIFFAIATNSQAQITQYKYNNTKNIQVKNAAVVSAHALASNAGIQVMRNGGNAFDAAIATQLALAVVYPGAGNLGGGGFMVAHTSTGKNIALDFREMAPAKAHKDMYLDSAGNAITKLSMEGHLASGVPGTVAGIFAIYKYAKLPFAKLIQPAIMLASKGFVITKAQADGLNNSRDVFLRNNKNPTAFVKKTLWQAGDTLVQTDLANTLIRIKIKGAAGFYQGKTALLIANEMQANNGIITLQDLKNYTVKERVAMQFSYKKYEILTMPLPSSGGIILEQLLQMTGQKNLASFPFQSAESVQLITEAERRAFADRAEFLGDQDFVNVPIKKLVSNKYLQLRMQDFVPSKAGSSKLTGAGNPHESEQTTHISITDIAGNAIAITTTLNDNFGSKTIITGAGFIMNNEMDDFSVKPGVPNMYGAIGNDKNAIAPGKRMLSSMTPTIVLKNNKPFIVVGSPGGTTIPTSVFQSIVNIIDYNLSAEDAVNKPKFHHQWLPDVIFVERDFDKNTIVSLKNMGYEITERTNIGRTELIKIDNKKITAIADKRGDDDARGF